MMTTSFGDFVMKSQVHANTAWLQIPENQAESKLLVFRGRTESQMDVRKVKTK